MKLPIAAIVKIAIGYISNVIKMISPDEITPEDKTTLQNVVGTSYGIAKNFGPDLVAKTQNDLDDTILMELVEVCEEAALKYDLELNPENIPIS